MALESKLHEVMGKAQPAFTKIDQLPRSLEFFISRVTVQIWRRSIGRENINLSALQTQGKVLAYDAGVLGEDLFRVLCQLDDFQGEAIRSLRKQRVLELKEGIRKTDVIRGSVTRWLQLLAKLVKRHAVDFRASAASRKKQRKEEAERKARAKQEAIERARVKQEAIERARLERLATEAREKEARAWAATRKQTDDKMGSRWRPNISQKEYHDGVRVFIELPGVHTHDFELETHERTVVIKGTRLGSRFSENLTISRKFDLNDTRAEFVHGVLSISLPYSEEHMRNRALSYL